MDKTESIKMRIAPKERQTFDAAAKLAGISMSSWMRDRLRKIARQELVEAGQKVPFLMK